VVALGGIAAVVLVLVGATQLTAAVAVAHRARSAADLAALAGAGAGQEGQGASAACARAAAVAAANGASLNSCDVDANGSALVTAVVPAPPGLSAFTRQPVRGVARAGPSP
jgi:secretion/DNA translocation related TadE-like protein